VRRFLFGQSEAVDPDQINGKIGSLVFNQDAVLVFMMDITIFGF
jgi:hypothetical protein